MGFSFATVLTCVFAGQVYLRYKEPELKRPIKVLKCYISKIEYSQTYPCGHLYWTVTCIKRSYCSCSVIENFIWIEPRIRGHLFESATFIFVSKMTS